MTTTIQLKRRVGGAVASPSATGAKEGEIALYFPGSAGGTAKPTLFAYDGAAWRSVNGDLTLGVAALTGGTAGSSAGIGAAWTGLGTKPTTDIVIATFAGTTYIKTGAGANDADWQMLGAAIPFASEAETLAGTVSDKVLSPALMRSATINKSSATQTNDANKIVRLDANGKIDAKMLPAAPTQARGAIDPTVNTSLAAVTPAPTGGDFFFANKAGAVDATFTGLSGATAAVGDMILFDGTNYHLVPSATDMTAYLPLAGSNAMTGNIAWNADKAGTVIIDAKNGTIDNVLINAGTY